MTAAELREEVAIELENLARVTRELELLHAELQGRAPTVREMTAAGAFLAQFYSGLENVLKRISRFHGVPLPSGDNWHAELFRRFCAATPCAPLPGLFDDDLALALVAYRKFRHVMHHGYGFQLDWVRLQEGAHGAARILDRFKMSLDAIWHDLDAPPNRAEPTDPP